MSDHNKPHSQFPWQKIKPSTEDAQAAERVRNIMSHPSYRQADHDVDFLNRDDTRAVRLQIDYLKPQLLLEQHGVQHTIVVFGSTRIDEAQAAQREVQRLQALLATQPDNTETQRLLNVAERRASRSHYYDTARELGRLIGSSGSSPGDCRITLITGGGPGIMEAANRGAFDAGAKSIGLNITLPHEQFPNPYITPDLCFRFHYFAMRKLHFLLRAKALVAFPGGYGTLDELFEALTLIQTNKMARIPVVLAGEEYWRQLINFDFLVNEGTIAPEDRELFVFAENAQAIWQHILQWHRDNGTALL
ncbi:MAG TPA: TIGR00730 family Rossman fold protein [Steroidobacteraceae bacterium]|nr:TIGR00730 family Rossman fold protein [Steroidobacteraceae bacterium]